VLQILIYLLEFKPNSPIVYLWVMRSWQVLLSQTMIDLVVMTNLKEHLALIDLLLGVSW